MESNPPIPASAAQIEAALTNAQRLQAVRSTGLLDTLPEESFDRLTRLAAKLTGAPVTFVSLLDSCRDFYKSAYGLGEPLSTTRQLSGRTFCHYPLVSGEPLVLDDVTQLPVYGDVPTVQSLGVRAYAGIPLRTEDDEVLGSFCAVDFEPRQWTERDVEVLTELAHSAMRELRLRKALQDAETLNQQLQAQVQQVDALNRALSELATTDVLTGLSNRRAFDHHLKLELGIVDRRDTPLSLLVLDVDHFKHINDTHGHETGDKVLQAIAQVLAGCARAIDMIARVGGEEFAVILPNTDAGGALEVAQRMHIAVAQAHCAGHQMTISVGSATLQSHEDATSLFSRADAALYAAKAAGRNRVISAA